jgi:hypothetical protein
LVPHFAITATSLECGSLLPPWCGEACFASLDREFCDSSQSNRFLFTRISIDVKLDAGGAAASCR